jgi:hypothetical protein
MAEATQSIHEALWLAIARLGIECPGGLATLAQFEAKKAIKAQLRSWGRRPTDIEAKEINAMARDYLASHPELFDVAADAIASYAPLLKLAKSEQRDRQRAMKARTRVRECSHSN